MFRARVVAFAVVVAALLSAAPASAVTGGTPPSRDYPHMAALLDEGFQFCGGSLVAPGWILTAAHCTEDVNARDLTVEIGGHSLNESAAGAADPQDNEVRGVAQIVRHPNWDEDTLRYDVALLRLSSSSTQTPIRLADPVTERALWAPGRQARVIGYGLPSIHEVGALFETDVPMRSDAECDRSYSLNPAFGPGFIDPRTMVCAGQLYGVQDSCFGDSGGPLAVPTSGTTSTGTLVQAGVVSFGFACGVPTQYGVYSRVADQPLHGWITSQISPSSNTTPTKPRKNRRPRK